MTTIRTNRKKKNRGGGTYAALAVLAVILLAVIGYMLFAPHAGKKPRTASPPSNREKSPQTVKPHSPPPPAAHPSPDLPAALIPKPEAARPAPAPSQPPVPKPPVKPEYPAEKPEPVVEAPREPLFSGAGKGRLAIIIDDMGTNVQEARSLASIGVPLTFSIIPGLRGYREVAAFAAASGVETMIHIPMQSKGWPQRRLESNGLLVSMSESDIRERLEEFVREIPGAVGANNHMGSEFTEHEEQMAAVLGVLKGRGLYFVDSVTSPKSVGQSMARSMGMKSGRRNVFLDNEQNSAYIMGQLNQAVRQARKQGSAIAICHPHPATIKTLSAALPALSKQGITLVPASRLVR